VSVAQSHHLDQNRPQLAKHCADDADSERDCTQDENPCCALVRWKAPHNRACHEAGNQDAGDLWIVPREGGDAKRLTTGIGEETDPHFSPDGTMIAFTGAYDGNTDVFVVPAGGGIPTRLTYHPGEDRAVGWTNDGRQVVVKVGPNSDGAGARDVTVVPVGNEGSLRNLDWIESNGRKVTELSAGKMAYVHLPDTANGGYINFLRYYFAQTDKQGAVIDERFNNGGYLADLSPRIFPSLLATMRVSIKIRRQFPSSDETDAGDPARTSS